MCLPFRLHVLSLLYNRNRLRCAFIGKDGLNCLMLSWIWANGIPGERTKPHNYGIQLQANTCVHTLEVAGYTYWLMFRKVYIVYEWIWCQALFARFVIMKQLRDEVGYDSEIQRTSQKHTYRIETQRGKKQSLTVYIGTRFFLQQIIHNEEVRLWPYCTLFSISNI